MSYRQDNPSIESRTQESSSTGMLSRDIGQSDPYIYARPGVGSLISPGSVTWNERALTGSSPGQGLTLVASTTATIQEKETGSRLKGRPKRRQTGPLDKLWAVRKISTSGRPIARMTLTAAGIEEVTGVSRRTIDGRVYIANKSNKKKSKTILMKFHTAGQRDDIR